MTVVRPRWVDPEGETATAVRIAFAYLRGPKTAAVEGGAKNYDAGDGDVEHNERLGKSISADNRVHGIGHSTQNTKYIRVLRFVVLATTEVRYPPAVTGAPNTSGTAIQ